MKDLLWYGGVVGATLCMLLILAKFVLLGLGADAKPRYAEIADKLPRTNVILCVLAAFLVLMTASQGFFHG